MGTKRVGPKGRHLQVGALRASRLLVATMGSLAIKNICIIRDIFAICWGVTIKDIFWKLHPFWPSVHPRPHSPPYPLGGISYCGENTVAGGNRGDHFSVPSNNSIWGDPIPPGRKLSTIVHHLQRDSKIVKILRCINCVYI